MAATNINRVVLTGNLTRDPELRSTNSGLAVCSLRIASNTRRKNNQSGEWEDKPNFFDVTVCGAQGENCARFLAKGRPVAIDGRLEWREFNDSAGNKRQAVEIVADGVQFLGGRDDMGGGGRAAASPRGRTSPWTRRTSRRPARRRWPPGRRRRHPVLARARPSARAAVLTSRGGGPGARLARSGPDLPARQRGSATDCRLPGSDAGAQPSAPEGRHHEVFFHWPSSAAGPPAGVRRGAGGGSNRRKPCPFCRDKIEFVDYKDVNTLRQVHLRPRQDPLAAHHRRLPPAPEPDRHGRQARP